MIQNPVSQHKKIQKSSRRKIFIHIMAGSARRMRQDRELASKLQEEDDRMFAMSMHGGFGGTCILWIQRSPLDRGWYKRTLFSRAEQVWKETQRIVWKWHCFTKTFTTVRTISIWVASTHTHTHTQSHTDFGDDYDNNDPDLVIPPKKK